MKWKEKKIQFNLITYNTIINGFFKAKKIESAENMFKNLTDKKIQHLTADSSTYNIMLNGYIKNNQFHKAINLFNEMIEK